MIINNNLHVLKFFADNKEKTFTILKAAEYLRTNYRIVYEEIMKLGKEGLIKIIKQGNANVCTFTYTYTSKIVAIEELRKQEVLKNRDILLLYTRVKEVTSPFYCFILFGSYANKTNRKNSDIDVCLITDYPMIQKKINSLLSVTPLPLHLQEFSSEEFRSMLKSKGFNVGNEILRNNIVLYGLESFIELIKNAER